VAVVLLPAEKIKIASPRGIPFEKEIHVFLLENFNGYTVASGNISGHWKNDAGRDEYGEHREYKVALPAIASTRQLEDFLGNLSAEMGEKCIYAEIGAEVFFIYPPPR
jgi:hypothetical protein